LIGLRGADREEDAERKQRAEVQVAAGKWREKARRPYKTQPGKDIALLIKLQLWKESEQLKKRPMQKECRSRASISARSPNGNATNIAGRRADAGGRGRGGGLKLYTRPR